MAERIFNTILNRENWDAFGNSISELAKMMKMDSRVLKNWIDLIIFIQSKPKLSEIITKVETQRVTYIIPKEELLKEENE